ncbi:MAG: galactose-1-phosphate uridylyltransferase [bacterium]
MPELRQNPVTKEWVIIAKERAKRPEDFAHETPPPENGEKANCPFCPGHEDKTPPEIMSFRTFDTKPNAPGWWVRVVPNKFGALMLEGKVERHKEEDFFMVMDGFGQHEVLIESPDHDANIATMEQKQVEQIFLAYRERGQALAKDPRFEKVIIFKNHGASAGTSLRHPHSQIIAMPITPLHIRHRLEEAMRYFDNSGKCVYCEMVEKEKKAKSRMVLETDNFAVFEPFAARSPFETWVMPKAHNSTFAGISPELCKELALVMRRVLIKIYKALKNPDYNYIFYSSPCHEHDLEYYHWHIKILPRVSSVAGFELGSGVYINTVVPEEAARYLRDTSVE